MELADSPNTASPRLTRMLMSLFQPMYFISGLFAFAILFLFPIAKHIEKSERRKYYLLQIITLIGAISHLDVLRTAV